MQATQNVRGTSLTVAASLSESSTTQSAQGPTSGFKIAASVILGSALLAVMILHSRPAATQTTAGVHYMPMSPMSHQMAESQHEQVMTDEPGSVHYLARHKESGPAPTLAPMTAGYRASTVVAQQEVHFVKWMVEVGNMVQAGDPLLVFSKNGRREELKSSAAGQIKELADVSEGDRLSTGTKLVIVGHPGPAFHPVFSFGIAPLALLIFAAGIVHMRRLSAYEQVTSEEKPLEEGLAPQADQIVMNALPLKAKEQDLAAASGLPRVMRAAAATSKARTDAENPMA